MITTTLVVLPFVVVIVLAVLVWRKRNKVGCPGLAAYIRRPD